MVLPEPLASRAGQRGVNLRAALAVLADGRPRTAKEIVQAGIAQRLLPHGASAQVLYVSLTQYLARAKESGRLQLIVQDADRRFRANHPVDDWPEPDEPARPPQSTRARTPRSRFRRGVPSTTSTHTKSGFAGSLTATILRRSSA